MKSYSDVQPVAGPGRGGGGGGGGGGGEGGLLGRPKSIRI